MTKKIVYRRNSFTFALVPKLCLGTQGCEAQLRSHRPRGGEAELPKRRSQAELGNEGIAGRRDGFTLVEMLVVIAIMLVIAALAAAFAPRINDNQKLTRAVDNLEQWLLTAKMRAKRDGLATGLRFVPAPGDTAGTYSQFQYIQQPEPLTGGVVTPTGPSMLTSAVAGTVTFANVDLSLGGLPQVDAFGRQQWLVQIGDYLEINGGGVYLITNPITANSVTSTSTVTLYGATVPGSYGNLLSITNPTTNYRILRQPRILIGEEPLALPSNYAANFGPIPGILPATSGCNVALGPNGVYPEILFSPTGAVIGTNSGNSTLVISVWDTTMELPDPNLVGIVGVQSRSGFIGAYSVSLSGNPFYFVQTARESGL